MESTPRTGRFLRTLEGLNIGQSSGLVAPGEFPWSDYEIEAAIG